MVEGEITLVWDWEDAQNFIRWCDENTKRFLAVDTETTDVRWSGRIRTVQVGSEDQCWVIPYERGGYGRLVAEAWDRLKGVTFLMHNFKFDQLMLGKEGLELPDHKVMDTRIMAHIYDPTRPTGLKPLSNRLVTGASSTAQSDLDRIMKRNGWTFATVPVTNQAFWAYGGIDTMLTVRVGLFLMDKIFPHFQRVYDLEYACEVVLKEMERRGVRIDLPYVDDMVSRLADDAMDLRNNARKQFGVENLTSNHQVASVLIRDGWRPKEWTDTGKPKMSAEIMEKVDHRLAQMMVKCKHLDKMASTQYLGGYRDLVDDKGMIHAQVNPLGARTSRMSVRSPALQTLHRDAVVRDAFIPRDGNRLILSDYDQMEARLAASLSGDLEYIRILRDSEDAHTATAAQLYGVREDQVTREMRQRTKNVVYSKIYCAGIDTFARTAGISIEEAYPVYHGFDREFPAIKEMQNKIADDALRTYLEDGYAYIDAPSGRRHPLRDDEVSLVTKRDRQILDGASYKLMNYLIQGTGADELKRAVVDADRAGISKYLVLLVHDETVWDVPADEVDEVSREIRRCMENYDFACPLTAGVKVVDRWGEAYR